MELLNKIQQTLKVPKSQLNKFGNFYYRNAEDILEAVKPLLGAGTLICSDRITQLGDRFYVETTAQLSDGVAGTAPVSAKGYAREPLTRKGMDDSQITGAAASYARKRALGNLFSLDDEKDADFNGTNTEDTKPVGVPTTKRGRKSKELEQLKKDAEYYERCTPAITPGDGSEIILRKIYDKYMESCPAGKVVDMATLHKAVWERYGVYPTRESSVNKVVSEIPIENVIVDNNFPGNIEGID